MPAFSERTRLHLWCPGLFGAEGGIQTFSAFTLKALQELPTNINLDVLVKHDSVCPSDASTANTRFHFTGRWPVRFRTLAFAAKLAVFGFIHRPSLIISTHLNFIIVAYWLKKIAGIPYWAVAHGIEAWDIKRSTLSRALKAADRILAVSSYTRERLIDEQNLDRRVVSLLPDTINPERFKIAPKPDYLLQRYGLNSNQPIILTVGRLSASEQYKGYDKMLEVLPMVRSVIPDVHYIIVGKGDDRARIERIISALDLEGSVTLAGYVSDEELCDYYNLCDVFAMPSKGEGFGIVYLEALVCGKPTLAGNKDGATDALSKGELGALVDPDNLEQIAQTLIRILKKEYPLPIMYRPGELRRKAIDTFGFERFKQTLSEHLEDYAMATPSKAAISLAGNSK